MAWGDLAAVGKLMTSLSQFSGVGSWQKGSGKSIGKNGKDKGKGANGALPPFQCCWDDCKAAGSQTQTHAGKYECHMCNRPRGTAQHPPLERCQQWVIEKKVMDKHSPDKAGKQNKGKGKDSGAPPKGKGKGKNAAPATLLTAEQLKQLRAQRLEALKTGILPTAQKTPSQAAAQPFLLSDKEKTAPKPLELRDDLVEATKQMAVDVKKVVDSLHSEKHPSTAPMETAEATVSRLLATSSPFTSDTKRAEVEEQLAGTNAAIAGLAANRTPQDNHILLLLEADKLKQESALAKWGKTTSAARRRQALVVAVEDFDGACLSQLEATARGKAAALERAKLRAAALGTLAATLKELQEGADEAVQVLSTQHEERATAKAELRQEVKDLIAQKMADIDDETAQADTNEDSFMDAQDDTEEPCTPTETENERDGALKMAAAMREKISQLQAALVQAEAATTATANEVAAATAPPHPVAQSSLKEPGREDLHLEFTAEIAQLPALQGTPSDEQTQAIAKLAALFLAIPWGSPTPAATFDLLTVPPCFVRSMVGNTIWEACWGSRQAHITGANWVPIKLLNVLKWAVESNAPKGLEPNLPAGKEIYKNIVAEYARARQAKEHGAQY